nr:GNAT family N-acetyltransferase [uncultured Rhodopila sp.]
MPGGISIRHAVAADTPAVAALFREYAAALGVDLCFQGFEAELAGLPGAYAAPAGVLLIAVSAAGEAIGCVGVRKLSDPGTCEMKRLYARSGQRGGGVGRALAVAAIEAARSMGYARMCLDTLPEMNAAQGLYRSLGFETVQPYYETPLGGTIFMQKSLGPPESRP